MRICFACQKITVRYILPLSLCIAKSIIPALRDEELIHDETSLLQVTSTLSKARAGQNTDLTLRRKVCNESLLVKGSNMSMPSRGFITCCNASVTQTEMVKSMKTYLQSGGRLIDTAPDYSFEHAVGLAVQHSGIPREKLWLSSKVDTDGWRAFMGSPKNWTVTQIDESLSRMGLSYLDSMVLHFGPAQVALQAPQLLTAMPLSKSRTMGTAEHVEMWRGLIEAKRAGKVRNIGVCETSRSEIENLVHETGEWPSIVLTWYHPWTPPAQKDYISWAKSKDIAVAAYGLFNFKFDFGQVPSLSQARIRAAMKAARRHSATFGQLAIKWALDQEIGFLTRMSHKYVQEDLECLDFDVDAADHDILASVPPWPCDFTKMQGQYMPGCIE
jgi:diketogulonate reductase-like aldo/keto reductase